MSIAILTSYKDSLAWKKVLETRLPEVEISILNESKTALKAEFLVCWKPKKNQLKAFKNLKVVQSLGAGVDHIFDTNKVADTVKVVRIIDDRLSTDMWEYCLAATMAYIKDFAKYNRQESYIYWQRHQYKTISNTTISILGLGQIGGYVAKQFAKFGFKVQGWSNSPKKIRKVKAFAGVEELPKMLNKTDVLINILPLTASTKGILNHHLLSQLPKGSYLINVGRGGHLVEEDLLPLIDDGQLSGATLDVFQTEPLPKNHLFWRHPKVQITPHVASLTNVESAVNQVVENYLRMKDGRDLVNEVSGIKGY